MYLGPDVNGAQMGTLSHFVLEALMHMLVKKGLLTNEEVLEVLTDAESSLRPIQKSEYQGAFKALNEKYIPEKRGA
jgi:hypothetical protein